MQKASLISELSDLQMPPWQHNQEGGSRRVGVEIEMTGLTLDALADKVAEVLKGRVASKGRYERELIDAQGQVWGVELDFNLLKTLGREKREKDTLGGELSMTAEETLAWFAENLVPFELVSPPLALARLPDIEVLIAVLREAGAKGSSDSLVNAFGLQLNPEIPDAQPATLTAFIKAFLCLYDWLYERSEIDLSRQVTSYINPFPGRYIKKLVAPDYWPDLEQLIDDYLADNPTRNRALDCLPLFMHLDARRVCKVTDDPLIKARPTFHYRLPSSEIHRLDWGLYKAWNDWVQVEKLAADTERLQACCQAYTRYLHKPLDRLLGKKWVDEVREQWLDLS